MPSEMEFVNFKDFVDSLPAADDFATGDKSVLSGATLRKMDKDVLLQKTAENALAGNNAYTDFEEILGNVVLKDYASSVVTIAVDNYYVKSSNSQVQSSVGYAISNTITLNAGESIFIIAGGASTWVAMISLYNSDSDTYSMVAQSTTSDRKLYSYKNDTASAVTVRLSYYKANKPYIYIKGIVSDYEDKFNDIADYEAIIGENLFVDYSSEKVSIAVDNYYVKSSDNQVQSATGYAISASITLKAGETIMMVAGGASTWVAMISLYNSGSDTYSMVAQSTTSDRKFYSYRNDSASDVVVRLSYVKARKPYIVIKGKSIGDASFKQFLADDYLARIRDLQVPHKFSPFTGGVVAFVFDDTLADVDKIANLFATKGKPCCFATIPSFLNSAASVSGTRGEALLQAQSNGCEILSHGSVALTSASSDFSVYNTFVLNKKKLVNYGFKVDGIIETGGTGYNTFNYSRGYDYLREFYSYSDGYGKDLGFPQYYLNNRAWLSSVTSDNRAIIDNAVSNNKFVLVSAHGVDVSGGVGLSVLEDVLDYAIAQNVKILTIRNVMTEYRDYD